MMKCNLNHEYNLNHEGPTWPKLEDFKIIKGKKICVKGQREIETFF